MDLSAGQSKIDTLGFKGIPLSQGDQLLCFRNGFRNWLFQKDMTAGFNRGLRIAEVRVRIGGDTDGIRLGFLKCFQKVAILRIASTELLVQFGP